MVPRLLSLLYLRLCVGQTDIPDNGASPKPSLSAWPSSALPIRSSVTLRCQSLTPSKYFILRKEGLFWGSAEPYNLTEETADFHITELRQSDGGHYTCEYYSKWPPATLSQSSDAVLLLVTGYLPKPSLQAHHRGTVTAGSKVTLQCQKAGSGVLGPVRFALLKVGRSSPVQTRSPTGMALDFSLQTVTARDSGKYSCVYYQAKAPYRASAPSDLLEISVIAAFPTKPFDSDPTQAPRAPGYLIRLGVAAVVLVIMGGFLAEAWNRQRLSPNSPRPHSTSGEK
ncbi:LOW QUALITY PROTEIN: T-cell-interacting, activating receptor on myeloid cells protein 1-like [Acomys russatus]|uniref:LOW QUALITY PROTEIN: T-cell-interacting, activating receptor on myeloid cells protein 1-like n=1 Tax=Acomys russatus TaxID=60746 RepID=UPI0021E30BE1|nr:LOW QUALITY PROTEIN: T-cell-interacting, activating receptor on myeloid cells protein 1-like [Acomys russatus]